MSEPPVDRYVPTAPAEIHLPEHLPREDPDLDVVATALYRLDPTGDDVAAVLRDTLDQLYDGQHTGRWNFDQLNKTEKTHMGTLVEINLHRRFAFDDGNATDYRIAGVEVDCKYSISERWSLPPEVIGQLALVVTANDERSSWRAGLVRVEGRLLNPGRNRDAKGNLSAAGRQQTRWLWPEHPGLAENVFLHIDPVTRDRIFGHGHRRADTVRRGSTSCSARSSGASSGAPSSRQSLSRTTS